MNLKCMINGKEYPLVQGVTFSEEYNETLDSAVIIISQIPKIENLKPYDDVFIYDNEFKGFPYKGLIISDIVIVNYNTFENPYLLVDANFKVVDTSIEVITPDRELVSNLNLYVKDTCYLTNGTTTIPCRISEDNIIVGLEDENYVITKNSKYYSRNTGVLPNNNRFYKHFLIDQFTEDLINIEDSFYKYKIELFSETKGLEAIQLPNISVTQPRDINKRINVYDKMSNFISVYSPKIKMSVDNTIKNFNYVNKYVLSNDLANTYKDTYSPDFSLNNPNLRDLMTHLMLTKDCIPYVEDNMIKALDITKRHGEFDFTKGEISYINGSRSSANHCDNLRRSYQNALSQDNTCKMVEYLGFRNKDNALMTVENMRLETRYPIYKINKIYMCYYKKGKILVPNEETLTDSRQVTIRTGDKGTFVLEVEGTVKNVKIVSSNNRVTTSYTTKYNDTLKESRVTISYNTTYTEESSTINTEIIYVPNNYSDKPKEKIFLCKQDITELVKLNSERALLKEDWNKFEAKRPNSIEELAKYRLCTVGYDIGENKISGWGTKYKYPQGWWEVSKTYIENILSCVDSINPFGIYQYGFIVQNIGGLRPNETFSVQDDVFASTVNPFNNASLFLKSLFFEVDYNAFYNGAVIHSKDDGEDLITINDNSSNSLTLLEQDGLFQKEKINRFGNKAYTISARYTNINDLQPLGCTFGDDNIVYHREYNIYDNVINCIYYATKDYVLKNYYTSVYAKHRPYNLMSYEESINRSENRKIIAYLSDTKPTYQDKNLPFDVSGGLLNKIFSFAKPTVEPSSIDAFTYEDKINCGLIDKKYLSDVNGFVSGNSLCFNLRMYDNASGGVYIKDKEPKFNPIIPSGDFTGSVQDWYLDVDDVETGFKKNMSFEVFHINSNTYFKDNVLVEDENVIKQIFDNTLFKLPLLNVNDSDKLNVLKNESEIYKDNKEIIDMTLQIEPIAKKNSRFIFSQWLMKLSDLLSNYNKFNKDLNIVDIYGFDSVQKIAYGTSRIQETNGTMNYLPMMLVIFDKEYFNNLDKSQRYTVNGSFNYDVEEYLFTEWVLDRFVKYKFICRDINTITNDTLYLSGNQTITRDNGFWGKVIDYNTNVAYKLKKITKIGVKDIPDDIVVFSNVEIIDAKITNWCFPESKIYYIDENGDKVYLDKTTCRFTIEKNTFIDYEFPKRESFTTSPLNIVSKDVENKAYKKNMFVVLSDKEIKKEIVYNEYAYNKNNPNDLPNKTDLDITDIIQVKNNKIIIDLTNIQVGTKSIQYWFLDNIKYSRTKQNNTQAGIWNSDFTKSSYKFVFGVNLTPQDFINGKVEIYINALNNRDFRVFNNNNVLIGKL